MLCSTVLQPYAIQQAPPSSCLLTGLMTMLLGPRYLMDPHHPLHPYRALSNACAEVHHGSSFIVSSSSNTCATVEADGLRQMLVMQVPLAECNNQALCIMAFFYTSKLYNKNNKLHPLHAASLVKRHPSLPPGMRCHVKASLFLQLISRYGRDYCRYLLC